MIYDPIVEKVLCEDGNIRNAYYHKKDKDSGIPIFFININHTRQYGFIENNKRISDGVPIFVRLEK